MQKSTLQLLQLFRQLLAFVYSFKTIGFYQHWCHVSGSTELSGYIGSRHLASDVNGELDEPSFGNMMSGQ